MAPIYPFIKWAGGKRQILKYLIANIPLKFECYYEPFLGGGALFFKLRSMGKIKQAVISDSNKDLINCYLVIRDEVDALISRLDYYQKYAGDKNFFYDVARKLFNKIKLNTGLEKNVEKAALFIYLNKTCFNGLYRVNSKGEFNVPWGGHENSLLYDYKNLISVSKALKNSDEIKIKCCDYREAVKSAQAGDFIYFDPPYQATFAQYTADSFSEEDQKILAETFRELDKRGCMVMLSNSKSSLIEYLYKDYISKGQFAVVMAPRVISCLGNERGKTPEYIIYNYCSPKS